LREGDEEDEDDDMTARIMTLNIHPSEKIIANLQLVRFG